MVGLRWTIVNAFVVLQPDNGCLKRIAITHHSYHPPSFPQTLSRERGRLFGEKNAFKGTKCLVALVFPYHSIAHSNGPFRLSQCNGNCVGDCATGPLGPDSHTSETTQNALFKGKEVLPSTPWIGDIILRS